MLIYKITCLINQKIYVGQTTSALDKRISSYKSAVSVYKNGKYKARSKIIPALAKYGFDNFEFSILENVDIQKELDEKEKYWISKLDSCNRETGFNIQLGGFGVGKHSDETKKIMSDKKKGQIPYNKGKAGLLSREDVGNAKLTQEQADQIRKDYLVVKSSFKLGKIYNVSQTTISAILRNETYKIAGGAITLPWFVYLIKSEKYNVIYTGITLDVERRLKSHNEGVGSKYTRSRRPFILFKSFQVEDKSAALKLEYKIKQLSREEKLKL